MEQHRGGSADGWARSKGRDCAHSGRAVSMQARAHAPCAVQPSWRCPCTCTSGCGMRPAPGPPRLPRRRLPAAAHGPAERGQVCCVWRRAAGDDRGGGHPAHARHRAAARARCAHAWQCLAHRWDGRARTHRAQPARTHSVRQPTPRALQHAPIHHAPPPCPPSPQCPWLKCQGPAPAAASLWARKRRQRCPPSRHPWRSPQVRGGAFPCMHVLWNLSC